jgi:folate-dependent tRNA-U54 methylase TrmFO/GidA
MNANFGIIPPLEKKVKGGKAARNDAYAARAIAAATELRKCLFAEGNTELRDTENKE